MAGFDGGQVDRIPQIRRAILADRPVSHSLMWAALAVAIPTSARWLIDQGEAGAPFITYFPFILLSSLLLGWRYAAAVAILSGFIANRLLRHEPVLWYVGWRDAAMVALFLVTCAMLIAMGEQLRRLVRELADARAREKMLNDELLHRAKNTLTIVGALAALTRRRSSAEDFFPTFIGRIDALNHATDLIARDEGKDCELGELIERATAAFRSNGNFQLAGPACVIPQVSCMPLMLVLHELSTNAVKHGALTSPDGLVALMWEIGDAEPTLILRWRESNGPAVVQPTHEGMGSALMRAQKGLHRVDLRLPSAGAECDIELAGARAL